MDIQKYRQQREKDVQKASKQKVDNEHEYALDRLNVEKGAQARAAAIASTSISIQNIAAQMPQLIEILESKNETVAVRMAALNVINTAAFFGPAYSPYKAQVRDVLHRLVSDKSKTIRLHALENLALEKDAYAKNVLMKALQTGDIDLIKPAKAIQLLGIDDHNDTSTLCREIFEDLDNHAKEEAVHILATDPSSAELLSNLMSDKNVHGELRRVSAYGLKELDPSAFLLASLKAISDPDDDPHVKAAYVTGAQQLAKKIVSDTTKKLEIAIADVKIQTSSRLLKKAANLYIQQFKAKQLKE